MKNVCAITISLLSLITTHNVLAKDLTTSQYSVAKDIVWAADKLKVPRPLLLALCWGEGAFRQDAKLTHMDGKSLSYHTCQVKFETAEFMDHWYHNKVKVTDTRLRNTKINAFYAAQHLSYQLKRYHNNWQKAVDAYNKGTAVSAKSRYVKRVQKNIEMLNSKAYALLSN